MILYYVQLAFTLWMLVDCAKRRGQFYWYLVLFAPFGPLVYFFVVKIHDYDLRWLKRLFSLERAPSVDDLRYRAKQTPSFRNRMSLASALHDARQFQEAADLFAECLKTHKDDLDALYGLGRARLELGDAEGAIEPLARLVDKNKAFRDYAANADLAQACALAGRDDEGIEVLEALCKASPRTPFYVLLARRLVELDRIERAREVLAQAAEDYEHAPGFVKRRDKAAAKEAAELYARVSPS